MRRAMFLLAVLLVASASAKYTDAAGDAAPSHDIVALAWGDDVELFLDASPDDAAGYTVIVFAGTEGAVDPEEWLVLHTGPGGDHAFAGHDPEQDVNVNVTRHGDSIQFTALLPDGDCRFAVGRSVTYPVEGQQVEDVIGWWNADIGDAWNQGAACSGGQPADAVLEGIEVNTTPIAPLAATAAAIWLLRRSQR